MKKCSEFLFDFFFHYFVVNLSVYLNRLVLVMICFVTLRHLRLSSDMMAF